MLTEGAIDYSAIGWRLLHPTQRKILEFLETSNLPTSPAEVRDARFNGKGLSKISYHFRRLHDLEIIQLKGTGQVRGATQHFYALNPGILKEETECVKSQHQNGHPRMVPVPQPIEAT